MAAYIKMIIRVITVLGVMFWYAKGWIATIREFVVYGYAVIKDNFNNDEYFAPAWLFLHFIATLILLICIIAWAWS